MKPERQINIFSVSFLDVFCCALGAMILIFILNSQMLSNTIKDSVAKYRSKAEEAAQEKAKALQERNIALQAKEESRKDRDRALKAKNLAEKAEKEALRSAELAKEAQQIAEEQKELAHQAEQEAQVAKEKMELALAESLAAQEAMKKAQDNMQQKNNELEKSNENLQQLLQTNKNLDDSIKKLVQNNESLQSTYNQAIQEKENLDQQIIALQKEKIELENQQKQLLSQQKQLLSQQKQLKSQNQKLNEDKQNALNRNSELEQRLASKEIDVQSWEQQIQSKEQSLWNREQELQNKENRIKALEEMLAKKEDKSLFGVQLHYNRIIFLVDKSGSIIQNKWKNVLIDTCQEILLNCEVDEFAIIAFSSSLKFYPSRRGLLSSGSIENKNKALQWLNHDITFSGATHLHEAIKVAYEEYGTLDAIFILTDGRPETAVRSPESLQKEILEYVQKKVNNNIKTKIIAISIGYPPASYKEYQAIYDYLHKISNLTNGQYMGR